MDNATTIRVERLRNALCARTGYAERDVRLVFSPLRVSPLGAHVDHQGGLVIGMALVTFGFIQP